VIAVVFIAGWPISSAVWHYWVDAENNHVLGGRGVCVTLLALWLLYVARESVNTAPPRQTPWAAALLLIAVAAAVFVCLANLTALQAPMLPTLMLLGVLTLYGPAVMRVVAVPIAFLYLAAPAWDDFLGPPLQQLTLWVMSWAAPVSGVPASVSGSVISLPGHMSVEVAQGCSGVGFLIEGVAIAALLGELEGANWWRRLALVAGIVPIALLANWARVLLLIHIGYSTGMRHVLVTRYHLQFGYVLFSAVLLAFLWLVTRHGSTRTPEAVAT
jgi:exosortase